MLQPLSVSAERLSQKAPASLETAQRVFRAMHGYYGTLFMSKWANGVVDGGEDKGVADALKVWAYELRRYDASVVLEAIGRCKTAHHEFPPSLPQFLSLCEASKPREVFKALPAPVSDGAAKLAALARLQALKAAAPSGLSALKTAIADAVACGGGDEVATLRRLDSMLSPRLGSQ